MTAGTIVSILPFEPLALKEFINKHLPEKFYVEGDQRVDLRDKIFREVIGNVIVHRDLPLFIFSYISRLALTNNRSAFTLKECLFLLISCWLINEVAFEFTLFIRSHIFHLIMIPVPGTSKFLLESILALPLLAVYFLGYHSATTNAVLIFKHDAEPELFTEEQSATSI